MIQDQDKNFLSGLLYKCMLKVVCIDTAGYYTLTLNKTYEVKHILGDFYYMLNDFNENFYPRSLFITLQQIRQDKLEKLLYEI